MIESLVADGVSCRLVTANARRRVRRRQRGGRGMVTHLFNAMAPFSHRGPGPGGGGARRRRFAGLICDGIHVDPLAVRVAWRALGPRAHGARHRCHRLPRGSTRAARLGDLLVSIDETGVRTPDGVLAGSNLSLDRAVRNLVEFTGCTAAEAVALSPPTRPRCWGSTDRGRIEVGPHADIVVLDPPICACA